MAGGAWPAQLQSGQPVERQSAADLDRCIQKRALLMTVRLLVKYRRLLRRFARDPRGVSAIEFAMVLPFMLTLYLGTIEVGNGMAAKFKATLAVRTVTDLASQFVSIDTSTMSTILNAASTVMTPYTTSGMSITLSEITTNSSGQGSITWSCSLG